MTEFDRAGEVARARGRSDNASEITRIIGVVETPDQ
jgi:hypothetical protein